MREILNPNLPNDDLDLQLLWLEILEKKGPFLTSYDLAKGWYEQCWYPFGEYGYFLKNYERGIYPPLSGSFNNQYFHDGMGCPIRSEIWAMVHPGRPSEAVRMAKLDACLDHYGNSYWAEVFLCALESMAFFEADIEKLISDALEYVEEDCKFKRCICMVVDSYKAGIGFQSIVRKMQMDFSHPDFTNSVQNLGYTVMALLFGKNDMEQVIDLALSCGYDTDCTCATAGAIVGIINGHKKMPEDLKTLLKDKFICGIDVVRQDDRIITLSKDTCLVGLGISEMYNDIAIDIGQLELTIPKWDEKRKPVEISIEYLDQPSIGFCDTCRIIVKVENTTMQSIKGKIKFGSVPAGWKASVNDMQLELKANSVEEISVVFETDEDIKMLNQKNIIDVSFENETGLEMTLFEFGIAGAITWNVFGPYIEPREFIAKENVPPCHAEDVILPPTETMFSNMALPEKEYMDESLLISSAEKLQPERVIKASEDLILIDENFGTYGEATFYLYTDLWFENEMKTWIVIGNSDAYKIWVNGELIQDFDEARTWQPQSHGSTVHFKEGANRVVIKLTRRAQNLKFSFGIRGIAKKHYHAQKWRTDFACLK
jgi:ADP-ribosylglycohydrolase